MLIQPGKEFNISEIMHTIKINFSRDANKLLGYGIGAERDTSDDECATCPEGAKSISRLRNDARIHQPGCRHGVDLSKYYGKIDQSIPKFKWQKSYFDHYIRSYKDFQNHLQYIHNQWIKHDLGENKYCFVSMENI